ncbi:YueI family protein [Lacticaseibacillus songhuajiangensis]|jgi:uncharacterized protein YueI|uniref:YueI family protein n=1 Tax=Lacticaseibacillus songhuajiangensis TaxID=1296539 RepID=UPI000F7B51AB|nr:YueI family protein [Lacticaseibacillus songhuajiangensis]
MAANDDQVQEHITSAIFGPRQTKIDERRHYLGSLRERVELRLTNDEIGDPATLRRFKAVLPQYLDKDLQVLINGKEGMGISGPYVKLCSQSKIPFTLINNENAKLDPDESGLLIVAKEAVFRSDDDIKLPPEPKAEPKKSGWFSSLFK